MYVRSFFAAESLFDGQPKISDKKLGMSTKITDTVASKARILTQVNEGVYVRYMAAGSVFKRLRNDSPLKKKNRT